MSQPTPSTPRRRQSARRSPGRPGTDSPDLRPHLIEAALACFVRDGIAATSLRSIASEAGVTPALLNYYFGSKLALRDAVFEERLMPAVHALRAGIVDAGDDPQALAHGFVRGVYGLIEAYPWFPALWVREVLCEGGALRELLLSRIGPEVPQMLAKRFAMAQQRGQLNPSLDPRLLVVSMIGLTLFPAAGAPIWRQIFQADLGIDALTNHALALLGHGMEPRHED
ncbi:TetR/AcrR family transcriptional regulator [Dyella solisilvae]|uniref:TetR/AcrR family transcriptional regulator n=1 Tax=Dyella solisilvae TaxID=1920168 RepID=A0A370KAT4_9GAMM|nr:TetR/AcrR family transcriptional regulator [Dyella solisilvae]RDI99711.1 TetR/AcrR family transcriptional regulator [Dyella solisilvae]